MKALHWDNYAAKATVEVNVSGSTKSKKDLKKLFWKYMNDVFPQPQESFWDDYIIYNTKMGDDGHMVVLVGSCDADILVWGKDAASRMKSLIEKHFDEDEK